MITPLPPFGRQFTDHSSYLDGCHHKKTLSLLYASPLDINLSRLLRHPQILTSATKALNFIIKKFAHAQQHCINLGFEQSLQLEDNDAATLSSPRKGMADVSIHNVLGQSKIYLRCHAAGSTALRHYTEPGNQDAYTDICCIPVYIMFPDKR